MSIKGSKFLHFFFENKTKIDFISIDTEGTEIDVLNGFDFDKYGTAGLISSSINEGHLIMNLQWDGGEYSGMVNSQGVP